MYQLTTTLNFLSIFRFRHLDTNVRPSSSRRNSGAGSSPSPDNDMGVINVLKSPKKSPNMPSKGSYSNNSGNYHN